MNKEKLQELLQLYVMNELDNEQKEIVENHLMESDEYKREYEELKKFYSTISGTKPEMLSDDKLNEFRSELLNKVELEKNKESLSTKFVNSIKQLIFGNYAPAYGMAVTLLFGFLLGFVIFNNSTSRFNTNETEIDLDAINRDELNISNVRFQNPFDNQGKIEIKFDAVRPVTFKGDIKDPRVQRLLAAALTKSDNPGVRIRTVNTLSSSSSEVTVQDPKIKSALINALKTDENDGVRREALNALMKYPFAEDIRDALLFVLANDTNPGLKVGAINALAQMKYEGRSIDNELRNVIENELKSDDENYIRLRAASLIQEVK
ncbi:MAG: HEAT repeat domain-containing protein [Melioribacteraceae bacterium]|nr:HEAT repeat domain-containing protein [Melioribacteraceae bacterium]